MYQEKQNFFKNHADAIVIVSVNIAICAIMISLYISNTSRIDSTNARLDSTNGRIEKVTDMFYDLLKEVRK